MSPEKIAQRFHETYELFAPRYGYQTRSETAVSWRHLPENNRRLMIAVVTEVLGGSSRAEDAPAFTEDFADDLREILWATTERAVVTLNRADLEVLWKHFPRGALGRRESAPPTEEPTT